MNKSICLLTFLFMFGATPKSEAQWYNIFKKEVNIKDLAVKQTDEGPYFYYEGELFTGTVIHSWDRFEVVTGRLDGLVKIYEDDGTLKSKITFAEGTKEGEFENYIQGKIKEKGTYKYGKLDGQYTSYKSDGEIEKKCTYNNGVLDGSFISYDWERSQTKCTYTNGEIDGPYFKYWSNGNLKVKCEYINGYNEGTYSEFFSNGQMKKRCNFKHGRYHGFYETFYENGSVCRKGSFINDERVGLWIHNFYEKNIFYQIEEEVNGEESYCKTLATDVEDGKSWTSDICPKFERRNW